MVDWSQLYMQLLGKKLKALKIKRYNYRKYYPVELRQFNIKWSYSGFWFIQDYGLFRVLVYTGFWLIQGSGLYRIMAYSGFWFIQDSGLFRVRFRLI
jgi:hypothetical protein